MLMGSTNDINGFGKDMMPQGKYCAVKYKEGSYSIRLLAKQNVRKTKHGFYYASPAQKCVFYSWLNLLDIDRSEAKALLLANGF